MSSQIMKFLDRLGTLALIIAFAVNGLIVAYWLIKL